MEPHPRTAGGRAGCRNRTRRTLEELSPAPDCPARRLGGPRKRVRKSSARCKRRILRPPCFTAFSEVAEPEEVMLVLREYQTKLGVLINKFEGTVERFSGDGLLVVFNDPLPCPDASMRAVQMALEMRDEAAKLSVKWSHSGHDIGFGVGIAHGYATLGSVGYEGRLQYSVTGKVANLASRLCDQAKDGQILVDINVFSAVETLADVEFAGELALKGFSRPVKAFNVCNLRSPQS